MSGQTILSMFKAQAALTPERTALLTENGVLKYKALSENVMRQGRELPSNGQPLLIMGQDKADFLTSFFAAMVAQRPAFPFPHRPDFARPARAYAAADADDFYWGATSGSTGDPKIFARSHASWIASFSARESVFPSGPDETVIIPGALSHSLFLYGAVHALAHGHTILAPRGFSPRRAVHSLDERRVTTLYAVPSMLEELLTAGLMAPGLRYVFCGGAKLGADLRRRFERAAPQADLIEFYGASELSFVSYVSARHPSPDGSVGRPFPGVRIEVRTPAGHGAAGEKGLIHISSPMLFSRYLGEPRVLDGAFVTAGDLGFKDADGFLYLTGRADREINSKGHKTSPEIVEAALKQHASVIEAAVVGVADEKRGAILAAAVEISESYSVSRAELSAHCRALLSSTDCPQLYFRAPLLPVTRTGKIAFAKVRSDLENGAPGYEALT